MIRIGNYIKKRMNVNLTTNKLMRKDKEKCKGNANHPANCVIIALNPQIQQLSVAK